LPGSAILLIALLSRLSGCLTSLDVLFVPAFVLGLRVRRIDQTDRDNRGHERGYAKDVAHLVTCPDG
jgi:hypothetical protein